MDNGCQLFASRERYVDRSGSLFHDILVIYFQGKVIQFPTRKGKQTNPIGISVLSIDLILQTTRKLGTTNN